MNILQCYQHQVASNNVTEQGWRSGESTEPSSCQGCLELRKEVNELRTTMNMLMPVLVPLYSAAAQLPNGLGAGLAPTTQSPQAHLSNVLQQNLLRKRPAPTPTQQQPECPVSMRPALNACNVTSAFMQYPFLLPMRAPSPTLPNGSSVNLGDQATSGEEQAMKWSSPSSVDSNGQKTDSSTVSANDSHNIDIVGDGSESSTSSASAQEHMTQAMQSVLQSAVESAQQQAQLLNAGLAVLPNTTDASMFFSTVPQLENTPLRVPPLPPSNSVKTSHTGPERKPRKPVNDDIVKIIRQRDLSEAAIASITIPVPEAIECDPNFRAVSEQQIIQQVLNNKKFDDMEVGECMIQLCKKLAEKLVFGPRLMSQTTVAGLNHSSYSNLPIDGICYIQHVCRKVLRDRFACEEDFWDKIRESMRKLAARCRRVRHAKKTKSNREEILANANQEKRNGGEMSSSAVFALASNMKIESAFESILNSTGNIPVGQAFLNLPNLAEKLQKTLKNFEEANAMTSLLSLSSNCCAQQAYKIETKPLSP